VNNRWSWLALGVGAYLAFTLAALPAGTAIRWFAPPGVVLSGIQGTVWSGAAAGAVAGGLNLQDLRWRVRPWSLLLGRLSGSLEARLADGFVNTDVVASARRVQFSNLRGGASLPALASVLPVGGMRGQASAQLSAFEITNGWPSRVVGELKVAGLEVAPLVPGGSRGLLPLGDYTVTFGEAPQGSLAARFVDNGGPLEVSGSVTLGASREYMLDALVEPRAGAPEQLVEGLKFMTSEPDPEGRRRLTLTGSL
jgi:general secretion pathway protein N